MRTDASWLDRRMIARLGNVLYWAACVLAVLVAVFSLVSFVDSPLQQYDWANLAFRGGIGASVWVVGRALKYVLAGC